MASTDFRGSRRFRRARLSGVAILESAVAGRAFDGLLPHRLGEPAPKWAGALPAGGCRRAPQDTRGMRSPASRGSPTFLAHRLRCGEVCLRCAFGDVLPPRCCRPSLRRGAHLRRRRCFRPGSGAPWPATFAKSTQARLLRKLARARESAGEIIRSVPISRFSRAAFSSCAFRRPAASL